MPNPARPARALRLLVPLLAVLALAACGSVKNELGVGRRSPDEFMVVKRAPLTLPPDYTLRPPAAPGEPADTEKAAVQARSAVLGASPPAPALGSGDSALLEKAGATAANPEIRRLIDEDNGYLSLQNRTVADRLIFWNDELPSPDRLPASTVDAAAEAARLKKNKAEGKPVNAGAVPVIEKKSSTLQKLF